MGFNSKLDDIPFPLTAKKPRLQPTRIMKLIISFMFLIIGQLCSAQSGTDTTISKKLLDSYKTENYKLKKANKRIIYQNRLLSNLKSIDTTQHTSDSIVITFIANEGLTLKRIIKNFRSPNCQSYETEEFFNDKGYLEYLEFWTCDCRSQKDVGEDEIIFQKLLFRQERFIYDSFGRLTAKVFIYSSSTMPSPRRYEYQYDTTGKATIQMRKISENEFWD